MYCILLASMKASTLLLINVTVSTLYHGHALAVQRTHGGSWLHPPAYFATKPRVVQLPRGFFHLIFMLAFVFLKAMFIHIDLHFSQTKTENILLREVESYGCFQFYSYHLPISSNFSTISMHSYAVKIFLIKFLN